MDPDSSSRDCNPYWQAVKVFAAPLAIPIILFKAYKFFSAAVNESLQDKVVLITGASSGIGEAIAHKFYLQGCKIILSARRIDELNRVKDDLIRLEAKTPVHTPTVMQIDLNDLDSFPEYVNKILSTFGHVDILINNGGIGFRGSAVNTTMDVDMKIMTVNYFAQVALTKAILPHMMKRRSGHIVYMNSVQGKVGLPRRSAYAASKHALQGFCDSLRSEVQRFNIKISTICPSYVLTPLSANALNEKGNTNKESETKAVLTAEEVADALLDAVVSKKNEIILGPFLHRFVAVYRNVLMSAYFKTMSKFEDDYVKKEMGES
ncbi:dehydrogenase/reductase SDR family protein 7-like [Arctopsyche grandis]|uniref:dehydrogenase/reductase SDR family protein 7-like n=1 Tax=Arctopsyche grandis TaxID=121162 RepID=UPI00406D7593